MRKKTGTMGGEAGGDLLDGEDESSAREVVMDEWDGIMFLDVVRRKEKLLENGGYWRGGWVRETCRRWALRSGVVLADPLWARDPRHGV
jgi:hypothetical protein